MDNITLDANALLSQYGGVSKNMLENITDAYVPDEHEINLTQQSPYFSIEELPSYLHIHKMNFNIMSLNVNSLLSKIDEIKILLDIAKEQNIIFDAICIQESHLDDTYTSSTGAIAIDNYTCVPKGKTCGSKGGLVIYVRDIYDAQIMDICPQSEIWEGLFVDIRNDKTDSRIIVGNIYKPPRNNNNNTNIECFINEITPVLKILNENGCDVALAGDYNINLLQLGERQKYCDFFDLMLSNSLYPKITFPTRISNQSCTLIDNIYCKLSQNTLNSKAGVIFSHISDHFPYFVSLSITRTKNKQTPKLVKQKLNSPNAIDDLKNELINNDITKELHQDLNTDPNINYEIFIKRLKDAKDKHIPTKMVKFNKHKHKNNKWITFGIIKSIKYRDHLHIKVKKTNQNSPDYAILKNNLKVYNSILKKNIREAKTKYYEEIFEQYKNDVKNTWKHINNLISKSNKKTIRQITVNGGTIKDKQKMADEFNYFFANIGSKLASTIDTSNKKPFNDYLNKIITSSFNFDLLSPNDTMKIIKSLKTKTSTGHDGISTKLLKSIAPGLINPLTLIINQSLITGIFPDTMKIAKVIPLFKKENPELVDNYRPVSLLCAISKVFEKTAYNQLYNYFKINNLFYNSQYGFRDEHSTELASIELIDRIFTDIDKKKNPITVYMDLSKAFDTLDHKILLHKLKYYGINGAALSWFDSYLSNRLQYVEIDSSKSSYLSLSTGVPQGSILGPLLFLIYMNDITESSSYFKFILYADDSTLKSVINTNDKNVTTTETSLIINKELERVNNWLAVNKLSLNVKKTKFMVFHTIQKVISPFVPDLKIGNVTLDRVKNFNFLGLTLNENMSWKPHTDIVANKISKYIGVMNRLKRYLPSHILKTIYNSLIQSNLNYSLLAWGFNCGRLKQLQKKAIRIIANAKYNSHTEPIMKKLEILKLEDLFKLNMLKWYFRFENKQLPNYFLSYKVKKQSLIHEYPTRINSQVFPPHTRIKTTEYCVRNRISVVLNTTPELVIEKVHTHSYHGFSHYAKRDMISKYSEVCNIENCYVCKS